MPEPFSDLYYFMQLAKTLSEDNICYFAADTEGILFRKEKEEICKINVHKHKYLVLSGSER